MLNFDKITNESQTKDSPNLPYIPDHLYRILVTGDSGSRKASTLFIKFNTSTRFYLYAKNPYESKYQLLMKKREDVEIKHFDDSKALWNM